MDLLAVDDRESPSVAQYEEMLDFLDPLSIGLRIGSTASDHPDTYGAVIHSKLLRLKMLGITDANCAKAAGLNPKTVARWLTRYPMLRIDMDRAEQSAVARAAKRLFELMDDDGPVALNAVKFFLSTHAEEFRERAELHLRAKPDTAELIKAIRDVYDVDMSGPNNERSDVAAAELSAPSD